MNFLDAGIIVVLFYNILSGLRKGLIKSLTDILGVFVGIVLASFYYKNFIGFFQNFFKTEYTYAAIISFVIIWCLTLLIIMGIGTLLHHFFAEQLLAPADKIGGMFFGTFIGILISVLILVPMFYFNFKPLDNSYLASKFQPICFFVMNKWLPSSLFESFDNTVGSNSHSPNIKNPVTKSKTGKSKTQSPKKLTEKQFEEILKKYNIDKADLESMIKK